jgi:TetR/AcrR family transcriptional regulator, cholesterol catabolism regulator
LTQIAPRAASRRRAEMVSVAARLFSERGYHGTSMQHLADSLGLLRGSLYAHIGSKQDLLFDVVDEGANRFLQRGARAARPEAPASERLRSFLVEHAETAIEHIESATVFLNEWRYLSDGPRATIKAKRDAYEAIARGIISDGIAKGEFRSNLDVPLSARLVLSAGNWIYAWYRPGGELSPAEVGSGFADLIVQGLAHAPSAPREAPETQHPNHQDLDQKEHP